MWNNLGDERDLNYIRWAVRTFCCWILKAWKSYAARPLKCLCIIFVRPVHQTASARVEVSGLNFHFWLDCSFKPTRPFLLRTLRAICMAAQICSFWVQARVATLISLPRVNYRLDVMQWLDTHTNTHVLWLQRWCATLPCAWRGLRCCPLRPGHPNLVLPAAFIPSQLAQIGMSRG